MKIHIPTNLEIKRFGMSKWKPLLDNTQVNWDAMTGTFELVEIYEGVSLHSFVYDVRDETRPSWLAIARRSNRG